MLRKVKDLSKVVLNGNDLLIRQIVIKSASQSGLILDATMNQEDIKNLEELKNVIVAKGAKVEEFEVGDIVSFRPINNKIAYDTLEDGKNADRYFVVGQHFIEYAVRPDNYGAREFEI